MLCTYVGNYVFDIGTRPGGEQTVRRKRLNVILGVDVNANRTKFGDPMTSPSSFSSKIIFFFKISTAAERK